MVGGLGRFVDPDILGSSPIWSSPGLPNTRFWQVGLCICGSLPRSGSKGPAFIRFHIIKKKKYCHVADAYIFKVLNRNPVKYKLNYSASLWLTLGLMIGHILSTE